ncbi:MAG TPA: phosphotransferase [Ktedonobacteraceae bacterium]|nr:phosphotransferase [Ktedonobacteraceae bacterium]
MYSLSDTAREEYLRTHLEERYGVGIIELHRLERGVFSVNLRDGRRWIARVFPAERSVEHVEGDARVLRFLEKHGFPAERCADADADPVSVLYGRGILVTNYIEGVSAGSRNLALNAFGKMLGRLNMLPIDDGMIMRKAGGLHHYVQSGGEPENDLIAAASWLEAIEDRVPEQNRKLYESLCEQVAGCDNCHNLPEAPIHPDPVLKNFLVMDSNDLVLIDWTGAGRGPRIASLAVLIWSCAMVKGGWSPRRVDAVVAGYRSYIGLEQNELLRLANVMRIRPLVFACRRFRHAVVSEKPVDGTEWWWPDDELAQAIAARACAAFQK